jgi:hypothetical protein
VKIDPPGVFSGKRNEVHNWIFVMRQYLDTVNLGKDEAACRLVVNYLML